MPSFKHLVCSVIPHDTENLSAKFKPLPAPEEYFDPERFTATVPGQAPTFHCEVAVEDFGGKPFAIMIRIEEGFKWPEGDISNTAIFLEVTIDGAKQKPTILRSTTKPPTHAVYKGYVLEKGKKNKQVLIEGFFNFNKLGLSKLASTMKFL